MRIRPTVIIGVDPDLQFKGAEAFGFIGQVWTSKRVAAVINRFLGVTYHRAHVSRLLRTLGFIVQTPMVRAAQRDEAVIAAWWDDRWLALKKRCHAV